MSYVWWEKTVEYLFVKEYIPCMTLFTPLDGRHELASDGILFNEDSWVLIEFKAKREDMVSEKRKFINYDECMKKVANRASHHYFIFGQINKEKELELVGCKYFDNSELQIVSDALSCGARPVEFTEYLIDLIECKKKASDLKKTIDYSTVLGISRNGNITSCLTIDTYLSQVEEHLINLRNESSTEDDFDKVSENLREIWRAKQNIDNPVVNFRNGLSGFINN